MSKASKMLDKAVKCMDKTVAYKGRYINVDSKGYATVAGNDFRGKVFATVEQAKREIDRIKKN